MKTKLCNVKYDIMKSIIEIDGGILLMTVRKDMQQTEAILKEENSFVKSEIEGLSDLLWSMGARTIYSDDEQLINWFYSKVPAFDNRIPMDILLEDGEEELYKYMKTIPC